MHVVQQKMKETQGMRLNWIHGAQQPSVEDIFEEWPRLRDANGYIWVGTIKSHYHENVFKLSGSFT